MPPQLQAVLDQLRALLAGPNGLAVVAVLALLVTLLLALLLRARAGGGGKGAAELKAAQNQLRLARGDAVQANRDHAAELAKLNKELQNLAAKAGGREVPEVAEWRQRALAAEERLTTDVAALNDKHRKTVEVLERALGVNSATGTVTTQRTRDAVERVDQLERDLAAARQEIEAAKARHQAELREVRDQAAAEKAAALGALAQRYQGDGRGVPAAAPPIDAAALANPGDVPDHLRLPFLEVVGGAAAGTRYFLAYGETTVGRDAANMLQIDDPQVSSRHAAIAFDGSGFVVRDHKSTNGTFLNEERLAAGATARIDFGDGVAFAEQVFRFSCAASDAAASDPALAAKAYEAMLRVAPGFGAAQRDLAALRGGGPANAPPREPVEPIANVGAA